MNCLAIVGTALAATMIGGPLTGCIHRPPAAADPAASSGARFPESPTTIRFKLTPTATAMECAPLRFVCFLDGGRTEYAGRSTSDVLVLRDVVFSEDTLIVVFSDEYKCEPIVLAGNSLRDAIGKASGGELCLPLTAPPTRTILRFVDHDGVGRAGVHVTWSDHRSATSDRWGVVSLDDTQIVTSCRCEGYAFVDGDGALRDRLSMADLWIGACLDVPLVSLGK